MSIRVAIVNHTWDRRAPTPDETLDRFSTLTGWSSAVRDAGAASVVVLQRFHRDAEVMRNGVTYVFCADAHPPRPSWWVRAFPSLDRATAGARADIVHVNGFECPRHLRRLRRLLDPTCALVAQDHGGIEPDSISAVARAWFAWGLSASDAMLISSAGQIDAFRRARLLPASVPAFDVMESSTRMTPVPREEARGKSGIHGSPAIVWVGRLNANKDPLTVVRGFGAFAAASPQATLTFVYPPGGDLEAALRDEVARTPILRSRVRLAGSVPHDAIASFYSAADLFVLGSHREGSGYAAIEAIACGAVPILTGIASFRRLTGDGAIGALWRVGDAASLCNALERASALPIDTQRVATKAWFRRECSWNAIGARALEIYRTVRRL